MASKGALGSAVFSTDTKFLTLHYVVETPMLYNNFSYPLYRVNRVPLVINDTCMTIDLPGYVYKHGENF